MEWRKAAVKRREEEWKMKKITHAKYYGLGFCGLNCDRSKNLKEKTAYQLSLYSSLKI